MRRALYAREQGLNLQARKEASALHVENLELIQISNGEVTNASTRVSGRLSRSPWTAP
jgi:hypothetical protein